MPTILLTGATGGLGLELIRQYAADGWDVIATARSPQGSAELLALASASPRIAMHSLDVEDFAAIDALAHRLAGQPIDLLLSVAGAFGPKVLAEGDPRQTFGHMDYAMWTELFRINTMAPLRLAEAFIANVEAGEHKKIVTVTSGVGSITNADGGTIAYRTSKAAANMLMHNLSFDLAPRGVITAAVCPGWVRTRMGGPRAPLEPPESITGLRRVIAALTRETSGSFWLYDGSRIPW